MPSSSLTSSRLCWVLAAILAISQSVPINRQVGLSSNVYIERRNDSMGNQQNVCMIDDVMYYDGDTIPTSSPCEHCVCRPPGFACDSLICEKRPGCRSVQRSNQCCAEYKCECEVNGRVYQNGERLEDPQSPCEVCYCQGGEMVCTVIECYKRKDCEAIKVPGVCCPKYDNCPPLDYPPGNVRPVIFTFRPPQESFNKTDDTILPIEPSGNETTILGAQSQETDEPTVPNTTSEYGSLEESAGNETNTLEDQSQGTEEPNVVTKTVLHISSDEATNNETTSSEEQSQDEYSTVFNTSTQQSASEEDAGNQTTSSEEQSQDEYSMVSNTTTQQSASGEDAGNQTTSSEEQSQDEYSTVSNTTTQQSASGEDAGNQSTSSEEQSQETAESTSQQSFLKKSPGNETPSSDELSQEVDNLTETLQSNKQEDHTASDIMKTTLLGVVDTETSTISNHLYEATHTEEEYTTFGNLEDLLTEPTITENPTEIKDTTLSNNIKDVPQEHKEQFNDLIKSDRPVQINQTFTFIKEETTSIDMGGMSTYSVTYTEYIPQDSSEKEINSKGTFSDQPVPITASQVKSSPTVSSFLEPTILTLKEEVQNDQFHPNGDEAVTSHQSFSTLNSDKTAETGTEQVSSTIYPTTSVTLEDKHQYPSRNNLEELEQDFYSGSGSGAPGSGMSSLEDQWSIPATSTEIHDSSDLSNNGNNTASTTGHNYTSFDNPHERIGEVTMSTDLHNETEDGLERFETAGPTSSSHTTISVGYGNTQFTSDSILEVIHSNNSLSSVTSLPNDEEGFQNDQVYSVGEEAVTTRQSSLTLNSDKTTETGTEQVFSTIYPTTSITQENIHQYPSRNNNLEELEQDFYSGSGSGAPGSGMSSLEDQWSRATTSTEMHDSSDSSDTGNNTGSTTEHDYTGSESSHERIGEITTSTELHNETDDGIERFLTIGPTSSSDAMSTMGYGDTHFTPKNILDIIHSSSSLSNVTSLPNDQSTDMNTKETANTRISQGHETSNYESESSTHVTDSMGDISPSSVDSQNDKYGDNLIKSPSAETVETFSNPANDYLENISQTDAPEIYETSSQAGDYTTESLVSTLLIEISTEGHDVMSNDHEILSKISDGTTEKLYDQKTQASLNQDTTLDSTLYPTEIPSSITVKSENILEEMQNDQGPVLLERPTNDSSSDFEGTVNNGSTLQSEEGVTSTEMVNVENNIEMGTKILPDVIELKSNKSGDLSMPENILDNQTGSMKANEALPQEWLKKGDINYIVHSGDYSATDATTTDVVLGEDMDRGNVATKNETLPTIKETNESQNYETTYTTTIKEEVSTEQTSFSQTTEDTTYSTIIAENGLIATVVSEQEEEGVIIKKSVGNHDNNLVEESFSKIQEEGILALSNSSSQEHNLFNIESNISSTSTEGEMTVETEERENEDQTSNKINKSNITESAQSQVTMSERLSTDSEKVKVGLPSGINREHKIEGNDLRLVQNFVRKLSYHQDYEDTPF